jgi:hypothetical protein
VSCLLVESLKYQIEDFDLLDKDFMSRKSTCQEVFIEARAFVNPNTIYITPL